MVPVRTGRPLVTTMAVVVNQPPARQEREATRISRFSLKKVRALAKDNGYKEISCDEQSNVISFRKESTRINVYYTTRTVGTCLNHPKRGKSQLFRRDVTVAQLEQLLRNPRTHTGKGYFHRKTSGQQWKKSGNPNGANEFEWDSARRWRFVCYATGIEPREDMIREVELFCAGWDSLYWEPGEVPRLKNIKHSCGSTAALCGMMLEEAVRLCGDTPLGIYKVEDVNEYQDGEKDLGDIESKIIDQCCNKEDFLEQYAREVHRLRVKLRRFTHDLRIELIQWFIARDYCGYSIYTNDMCHFQTRLSFAVNMAHLDYGKMMYSKKWNMCPAHGVY